MTSTPQQPDSHHPQLLYFDIRGRAEPVRLLLEELAISYQDQQITLEEWPARKATTPFRRMPVYSVAGQQIPETYAIMNHLGRQYDLLGNSEAAKIRCDVTVEACRDYGNRVANAFGAQSGPASQRKEFINIVQPALLSDLQNYYLARDSQTIHWAGDTLTIADFVAFHLLEGLANQFPETLGEFTALSNFHGEFSQRPRIKSYLASPRRPAALFYGPNGKIFPRTSS